MLLLLLLMSFEGNHPLDTLAFLDTTFKAERRACLLRGSARSAGALPAKSAAVKRERRRQARSGSLAEEGNDEDPSSSSTRKGAKASRSPSNAEGGLE